MRNRDEREEPDRRPAVAPSVLEERRTTAWIGKAVTIEGNVVASENLIVDGQVKGHIDLRDHHLTVGVGAAITGEVRVRAVTIRGAVMGNISATERIEILETGSVDGDIRTPRLAMLDGAVLSGNIDVEGAADRVRPA